MRSRLSVPIALVIIGPVLVILAFFYGYVCNETRIPPYDTMRGVYDWARSRPYLRSTFYFLRGNRAAPDTLRGSWQLVRNRPAAGRLTEEQKRKIAELQALGYMSGYSPAGTLENVTIYLPGLAFDGFNLITSGDAPRATLVDMKGRVLHTWACRFEDAFPDYRMPTAPSINPCFPDFWRHVHVYENGDLLAIYDGFGLIKLDRDSRLLWAVPCGCHHDLCVTPEGLVYVLSRQANLIPRIHPTEPVLEDFIVVMNEDGEVLRSLSILEAFEQSTYASLLESMPDYGDIFHTNAIQVLDGSLASRSPLFARGNILISVRNINAIAILDGSTGRVVWALTGQWTAQHKPILLPSGNILLFDNKGNHGMSKVIEVDPFTQAIVWAYYGTPENGFYTESGGSDQRLPNGNTLIVESEGGRAFEVTASGDIVWEFYNPARAGGDGELVATLFDVYRLAPETVAPWLERVGSAP